MEKEVGSIVPGKLANFTILADNPVTCDAARIKDIGVRGTVHEGRVLPVTKAGGKKTAGVRLPEDFRPVAAAPVPRTSGFSDVATSVDEPGINAGRPGLSAARTAHHPRSAAGGCSCSTGRVLAELIFPPVR
jgi:hypothetical protein